MDNFIKWLLIIGVLSMVFAIVYLISSSVNYIVISLFLFGIILFLCRYLILKTAREIYNRDYESLRRAIESIKDRELQKVQKQFLIQKEAEFNKRERDFNRKCEEERNKRRIELMLKDMQLTKKFEQKEAELKESIENERMAINEIATKSKKRIDDIYEIIKSSTPFTLSSSLVADMNTFIYDQAEKFLLEKPHPALKAAEIVKGLKIVAKSQIFESKQIQYRIETLLSIFPELSSYLDEDEATISLSKYESIDEVQEDYDRAKDYLSEEEYEKLEIDDRNQLALDRYRNSPKSPWRIGVEYEQYIEYYLQQKGFITIPFGSQMGLNDLGRDIIARRNENGQEVTYIIQCKNWSRKKKKEIHENVVCQIYGTALEYALSQNANLKVVPVIVSTVQLSKMAQQFANRLGVEIHVIAAGNPPLIKCNINNAGEKIYHLPFDQQYYRTQIKNEGECCVFTVKEATQKGFRRAKKYYSAH